MEGDVSVTPFKWTVWGPRDPWYLGDLRAHFLGSRKWGQGTLTCRLEISGHGEFRAPTPRAAGCHPGCGWGWGDDKQKAVG